MKILLHALPRTGSSNLGKGLAYSLGLEYIFEPFSYFRPIKEQTILFNQIEHQDNIIVKHLCDHYPLRNPDLSKKFFSMFDKTIFLTRENRKDHLESIIHLHYLRKLKVTSSGMHKKYSYSRVPKDYKAELHEIVSNYIKDQNLNIRKFNGKLFFYEDIFNPNPTKFFKEIKSIFPDIDLKVLEEFIDVKNKYRTYDTDSKTDRSNNKVAI